MTKYFLVFMWLFFVSNGGFAQEDPFSRLNFLLGEWEGIGAGFGNSQSKINSSFDLIMDGQYIQVLNDSKFEPTAQKPEGEHHQDLGIISYDKARSLIIFRQFNIEGYMNQYILVDSISTSDFLVFETEKIENFVPGGSARWTIEKMPDDAIETKFYVTFPGRETSCFGTNLLTRKR